MGINGNPNHQLLMVDFLDSFLRSTGKDQINQGERPFCFVGCNPRTSHLHLRVSHLPCAPLYCHHGLGSTQDPERFRFARDTSFGGRALLTCRVNNLFSSGLWVQHLQVRVTLSGEAQPTGRCALIQSYRPSIS
ncbi:hypothetical protein NE237_007493 [Protea cynaroides]|uniref:Uncharacterized protein n=1 Tax=Protea cynaroides TaxID=273540 RepID=A0A9Q0KQA0_9MAGN|nr:hypothetical protein NE237_007493 [Protea cynaroides]